MLISRPVFRRVLPGSNDRASGRPPSTESRRRARRIPPRMPVLPGDRAGDQRDDARLGVSSLLQDEVGHARHQAGLVEPRTDDHDRDDRDHGVAREPREQFALIDDGVESRQHRAQTQEDHQADGRDVDAEDLEREQDDRDGEQADHQDHLRAQRERFDHLPFRRPALRPVCARERGIRTVRPGCVTSCPSSRRAVVRAASQPPRAPASRRAARSGWMFATPVGATAAPDRRGCETGGPAPDARAST